MSHRRRAQRFLSAVLLGIPFIITPPSIEAGSLARSVAKSAAKRSAASLGGHSAARAGKPADVIIHRSKHPQTAQHIEEAQRLGQPSVLTIDRSGAAARRHEAMAHVDRPKDHRVRGRDRDEYPPAMTREGGGNSDVRYVGAPDNRGAGRVFGHQTRHLPDGSRVSVHVTD